MGLDISKIQNAELQRLAYLQDTDDEKGILSKEEFELFKQEAAKRTDISDEDFNQAMGLYTTNPVTKTEPVDVTESMTKKQTKKWNKAEKKEFFRQLEDLTEAGVKREFLMAELESRISNPEFKQAVADVLACMPAKYNSLDNVKDMHSKVEDNMEANGIKDDLHKDILKHLENMGRNEVKADALAQINDMYMQKLEADEAKGVHRTDEEIMKEIKKDLKKADKYKDEFKDQFEAYEKDVIMYEARKTMSEAVYGVLDETKWRKVSKEAKKALKESGEWDKYTKKALKGNRNIFARIGRAITGTKTDGRRTAENQARANNVTKHTIQSTEDVMDGMKRKRKVLGVKIPLTSKGLMDVFVALKEAGLVKQLENGDWDLSELSEIIGTQVGSDSQLNRHAKIDKAISEKLRTTGKLSVASKLTSLTEDEAQAIVKLCGYDIEGKNWGRAIFGALFGAAAGAASGAGAAITNPQHRVLKQGDLVTANTNIELKGDFTNVDLSSLPEGTTVIENAAGIIINVQTIVDATDKIKVLELSKYVGLTAMKAAILPAVIGLLSGLGNDKGEVPVSVIQFSETDINEYSERVKKETPAYAPALIALATTFVKDGKWDVEGYKQFLNDAAGDGGKLNKNEFIGALKRLYVEGDDEIHNDDDGDEEVDPNTIKTAEHTDKTPVYADVPTIDGTNTGWKEIAGQYECLEETFAPLAKKLRRSPKEVAIRIIKIAQGINNGNYSLENLEKLVELSYKGLKYMQNIEGLDYNAYKSAYKADYLGIDVKVPVKLAGCVRDPEKSLKGKYATKQGAITKPTGSAPDRVQTGVDEKHQYGLRLNGGAVEAYTSMKDRDDKVAGYKKQYPNATIEKVTWEDLNK